ncbi:hypothetical protein BZA05DRAFT_476717 [Tricharina praecox]|uniref:uncharacterized protein n=1 Tax=Tricharina praecox TaxID=43433 RepID=UPI00221F2616|nr:uncharacterized protein BZA05DRAFT_439867 [Tricharina praecox]XP_051336015.1 uncharacterized protein BZA05DRAFT_476717 [Tricharina praecox]KAI5840944.1 hypothetical protein BZA05DRAFT_439867 [Tricharina praecox]KAI5844688.1 hypothetical protein BZA05DRAFT_476717 [Tricharina praecox]
MSHKGMLEKWALAIEHHEARDYELAVKTIEKNDPTAKGYFNIGMIHSMFGWHGEAVTAFIRAVTKDPDLAIAWFQLSVCNFLLGEFEEAALNANECYAKMRGNPVIDYQQLGLDHKLHSCEVLYNRGICSIYDGAEEEGIEDLIWAAEAVTLDEHKAIREAIEAKGKHCTVFSVGAGNLFRPPKYKIENLPEIDYLGTSRLIHADDPEDHDTGFTGHQQLHRMLSRSVSAP